MFAQTFFIVWRESIEALLVIGILHAWLSRDGAYRGAMRPLWAGVAAGIGLAFVLAFIMLRFGEALPPGGQDYFQTVLVFTACALIVQMVFWMRRHGRGLKAGLEQSLTKAVGHDSNWGVFAIAMIAVAREGTEVVVFLYGVASVGGRDIQNQMAWGIALASVAAIISYALLQLGKRWMSWRWFFRLTEAMLLFLAAALFVKGMEYLVSFGVLPYSESLWNTSFLIDDTSKFGGVLASLTGYRAAPDWVNVLSWIAYWGAIFALNIYTQRRIREPRAVAEKQA